MKKLVCITLLLAAYLGNAQAKQDYIRYGKRTTAQINAIDTTRTDVIYAAYNTDLGIEVVNKRDNQGWVARFPSGAGTGDLLSTNNLSDLANITTSRSNLGLGNVDNTSDVNKPISTATQSALDSKEPTLGNPASNGQILSSTTTGNRSWIDPPTGGGTSHIDAASPITDFDFAAGTQADLRSASGSFTGTTFTFATDGSATTDGYVTGGNVSGTDLILTRNGLSNVTIDASGLGGGSGTDDQNLSLSGNTINIEDGTGIDISTATAVAANTAKVSNATHTGDVTGSSVLTISNNSITQAKMADDAVGSAEIIDGSIGTNDIGTGQVWTADINDQSVTNDKIAIGTIQEDRLNISNAPTTGYSLTSDGSDGFAWTNVSGGGGLDTSSNLFLDNSTVNSPNLGVKWTFSSNPYSFYLDGINGTPYLTWNLNGTTTSLFFGTTNIRPSTTDILDLGTSSLRFKQAWFSAGITADSYQTTTGTASEFLKANGSVDSNKYLQVPRVFEYIVSRTAALNQAYCTVNFSGGTLTYTIENNATIAFDVGTYIFVENEGATNLTITAGTGVTLVGESPVLLAGEAAKITQVTTDEWKVLRLSETGSSGGSVAWGGITGTLSGQTDLQAALDAKQNTSSAFDGAFSSLTSIPAGLSDGDDDTQLTDEQVQDKVGAMVTGNTETGISVTYNDAANKLDFSVTGGGITESSGTWTPTIGGVKSSDYTITSSSCTYYKVGKNVYISGDITIDKTGSTNDSSADFSISGLPFTVSTESGEGIWIVHTSSLDRSTIKFTGESSPDTSNRTPVLLAQGGGMSFRYLPTLLQISNPDGTSGFAFYMNFSGTYLTDD